MDTYLCVQENLPFFDEYGKIIPTVNFVPGRTFQCPHCVTTEEKDNGKKLDHG